MVTQSVNDAKRREHARQRREQFGGNRFTMLREMSKDLYQTNLFQCWGGRAGGRREGREGGREGGREREREGGQRPEPLQHPLDASSNR